jgi:hypothetical protein
VQLIVLQKMRTATEINRVCIFSGSLLMSQEITERLSPFHTMKIARHDDDHDDDDGSRAR